MQVTDLLPYYPLLQNVVMSAFAFVATFYIIPEFRSVFLKARLCGTDMSKRKKYEIPEAMGVLCGCTYMVVMFLFIPVPFATYLTEENVEVFPHSVFVEFIAALLSICCMIFLGFADDVLNLRWRDKLFLPLVASLPLLMVYYVNYGSTTIVMPKPLRSYIGMNMDLGIFYYVYMLMLAIFCTNAINILAGVNGLESAQSAIIAVSIITFNCIELGGDVWQTHLFSLYLLLPYLGVCLAITYWNWYPSSVFVGDTWCYFSGMTFACVAILGHFSKTMLLFWIPQTFNFLYSIPQLFHFVPCPRHRLPKYDPKSDTMSMSYSVFREADIGALGKLMLHVLYTFGMVDMRRSKKEDDTIIEVNNLTIINLVLKYTGPLHEQTLTVYLLCLQVLGSIVAFLIRYKVASLFYDV